MTEPNPTFESVKELIARSLEQGLPVIWSFVPEIPIPAIQRVMPWLAVSSWVYDGWNNNGMPDESLQVEMLRLETALSPLEESKFSVSAHRRTGNGLKEFVFYTSGQAQFMEGVNKLLAEHPRYPLEIKFYEDPE